MNVMEAALKKGGISVSVNDTKYGDKKKRNHDNRKSDSDNEFWDKYLKEENKYFLDVEKKQVNPMYVDKYAKKLAEYFADGWPKTKITQIRGFFNTVVKVNRKMNGNLMEPIDIKEVLANLARLKAIVNRKYEDRYVSRDFQEFIVKNVDCIKDGKDLKAFKMHFEAIVGYMKKD